MKCAEKVFKEKKMNEVREREIKVKLPQKKAVFLCL